jgi:hypothetical protein
VRLRGYGRILKNKKEIESMGAEIPGPEEITTAKLNSNKT